MKGCNIHVALAVSLAAVAACEPATVHECAADAYDWEAWLELPALSTPYCTDDVMAALSDARPGPHVAILPDPLGDVSDEQREQILARADAVLTDGFALRDNPIVDVTAPIDWGSNPAQDDNWHYQVNAMRPVEPLFAAYAVSGDAHYYDVATAVVRDWVRYNIDDGRANAMKWHDMGTGLRAVFLLDALDYELRLASPNVDRVFRLVRAAKLHMDVLRDPATFDGNNHSLFVLLGLEALSGQVPELRAARAATSYGHAKLTELLSTQFSDELVHLEHSPSYHVFVGQTLARLEQTGLFDDVPVLRETEAGARAHYHELFHPNADVVHIGDSNGVASATLTPMTRYVITEGASGERPPDVDGYYPDAGVAMFRSPWSTVPLRMQSFLYFAAGFHSRTHMHADFFTFEWSELGMPIVVDSGKYAYGAGDWRKFFLSTRAGNTVEVDGRTFRVDEESPYGSALTGWGWVADGVRYVEASAWREQVGLEHTRMLVFAEGRWLLIVDRLDGDAPHTYRQWFGFHEDIDVAIAPVGFRATLPDGGGDVYLQELDVAHPPGRELTRGEEGDRPQGWISRTYYEKQPRYSAAFGRFGDDAVFVTLLSLRAPVSAPWVVHTPDGACVRFVDGDGTVQALELSLGTGVPAAARTVPDC